MTTQKKIGPDHYRYRETGEEDGVKLICQRYIVVKETPKGYWVLLDHYIEDNWHPGFIKRMQKFVLKDSGKRYCYPDRKDALNSFRIRKDRQLSHLRLALALAEYSLAKALELIAAGTFPADETDCGRPDYFDKLNFDC